MENKETIFIAKIQQALTLLNEIDEIIKDNPTEQSNIDLQLSDYYHLIQEKGSEMSDSAKVKLIDHIEEIRLLREQHNDIYLIGDYYSKNRQKLQYTNGRNQLYNELSKLLGTLHKPYNYRVLDENQINSFMTIDNKSTETIEKKNKISKEELERLVNEGKKSIDIAKMYGLTQQYICVLKKKYGIKTRKYTKGDK